MELLQLLLAASLTLGAAAAEPASPPDTTDARATIIELGAKGDAAVNVGDDEEAADVFAA